MEDALLRFRLALSAGQNGTEAVSPTPCNQRQQQVERQAGQAAQRHPRQEAQVEEAETFNPDQGHQKGREETNHGPVVGHRRAESQGGAQQPGLAFVRCGTPAGNESRRRRAAGRAFHSRTPGRRRRGDGVAFSQKVSCRPHTSAASTGGSQAAGMEGARICRVPAGAARAVRSCGSKATERASKAKDKAAQTAANKFSASGIVSGRQPAERVSDQPKKRAVQLRLPGPAGHLGHLLKTAQRHPTIERHEVNGQSSCRYQPRQECGDELLLRTDFLFRCHAAGQS